MTALEKLQKHFGDKPPIRCKSMIVTIMGDIVFVHGGVVNTAIIIALNALFGIGKHSSRIGISRLVAEDWLRVHRTANFSDNRYQLGNKGLEAFRQSAPLIYGNQSPAWQNHWQLLLFDTDVRAKTVRRFIRTIGWLGYGKMSPTVYLCPATATATDEVNRLIAHYGLEKKVWLFRSALPYNDDTLKRLATRLWDLKAICREYAAFMRKFNAVKSLLPEILQEPDAAMYLRLRLVHEYRRLVLHTPPLPRVVRHEFFSSDAAFALCGDLYAQLARVSGDYVTVLGGNAASVSPDFNQRFCQSDDSTAFPLITPAFKLYA